MSSLQSRILIGIVVFCFVLAFKEFVKIINTFNNRTYWFLFGIVYIFGSMAALIYLRSVDSILNTPLIML